MEIRLCEKHNAPVCLFCYAFTKEEILAKIDNIYGTNYERERDIKIVKKELFFNDGQVMAWKMHKSDGDIGFLCCLRLGIKNERWGHVMFITEKQAINLETILNLYKSINKRNTICNKNRKDTLYRYDSYAERNK